MSEAPGRHAADQAHSDEPDDYTGAHRVPTGRHHRVEGQPTSPEVAATHSPEAADSAPLGGELVERFRALSAGVEQASMLQSDELQQAIKLAQTNDLEDDVAQELVGSMHYLNQLAQERGDHHIEPLLAELKQAIYCNPDVQPVHLEDQLAPGAHSTPLHKDSHVFEWTGQPIKLHVPGAHDKHDPGPDINPNAHITLTLGPNNTWYKQIGHQRPEPLPAGEPLTLGRARHTMEDAPNTLGPNNSTSRSHLTLEAMPPVGIQVTDHSTLGTHFETERYPTPSEYRAQIAATAEDARLTRLDDSRRRLEIHHEEEAPDQPADDSDSANYDAWYR